MTSSNLFDVIPDELAAPDKLDEFITWLKGHNLTQAGRRLHLTHWARNYNVTLTGVHFRRLMTDDTKRTSE